MTSTQDQLKELFDQEFRIEDPLSDNDYIDGIWNWITTVYEPKMREEERERLKKIAKNLDVCGYPAISDREYCDMVDESFLPTPEPDHE